VTAQGHHAGSSPPGRDGLDAGDDELRDVSKPIAFDERGNSLYAPRGFVIAS
jgi:hypothetical protein